MPSNRAPWDGPIDGRPLTAAEAYRLRVLTPERLEALRPYERDEYQLLYLRRWLAGPEHGPVRVVQWYPRTGRTIVQYRAATLDAAWTWTKAHYWGLQGLRRQFYIDAAAHPAVRDYEARQRVLAQTGRGTGMRGRTDGRAPDPRALCA